MRTPTLLLVGTILVAVFIFGRYWWPSQNAVSDILRAEGEGKSEPIRDPAKRRIADTQQSILSSPNIHVSKDQSVFDEFTQLLKVKRFTEAIDLYQQIYSRYNETFSRQVRMVLIEEATDLMKRDLESASQLLTSYVQVFYRDVDALLRLATILEQQRNYQQSILRLQDAYVAAHQEIELKSIQSRIDRVINQYAQQTEKSENYARLVGLYRLLTERQPDHAAYYLELARAQLSANDSQSALATLRYIQYDSDLGSRARELISAIEESGGTSSSGGKYHVVPLISSGNHFFVTAQINGYSARLLLDTGASITVIKSDMARTAGININHSKTVVLNTANGPVRAETADVNQLRLGEILASNIKIVVLDLEELSDADGLLGMDFLSRYRFTIDRDRSALLLNP